MEPIYYEDLTAGQTDEYGHYEVTREEIVEFAGQYDPQPFHVDEDAAADSPFGGIIASGWHTAAMTMRILVDGHFSRAASHGAVGIDELRWRNPVRPGDTLAVRSTILEKDDWDGRRGLVRAEVTTVEADEDTVLLTMKPRVLYAYRDA
jgi:acyl dehydratase